MADFLCKATRGTNQPDLKNNAYTAVLWSRTEYDTGRFLQGDKLIVPTGGDGLYDVGCQVAGVFTDTGKLKKGQYALAAHLASQHSIPTAGMLYAEYEFGLAVNGYYHYLRLCRSGAVDHLTGCPFALKAGDRVDLIIRQWTGKAVELYCPGYFYPALWLARIGSLTTPPVPPLPI